MSHFVLYIHLFHCRLHYLSSYLILKIIYFLKNSKCLNTSFFPVKSEFYGAWKVIFQCPSVVILFLMNFLTHNSAEYRPRVWSVSKVFYTGIQTTFANQNIFIYSRSIFSKAGQVMGHPLDLFRIARGTDLTHTLLMTQLDWRWPGLINSSCEATFFFFNAMSYGMWNLSSLTRDWTCAPCSESAESILERQGSHQPQLISQRDMPCRWECLCPPYNYKVSSRWTQISIMTWTKK